MRPRRSDPYLSGKSTAWPPTRPTGALATGRLGPCRRCAWSGGVGAPGAARKLDRWCTVGGCNAGGAAGVDGGQPLPVAPPQEGSGCWGCGRRSPPRRRLGSVVHIGYGRTRARLFAVEIRAHHRDTEGAETAEQDSSLCAPCLCGECHVGSAPRCRSRCRVPQWSARFAAWRAGARRERGGGGRAVAAGRAPGARGRGRGAPRQPGGAGRGACLGDRRGRRRQESRGVGAAYGRRPARKAASLRTAAPRWERACFAARVISAKVVVRPCGTKYGS